jgi:hypothetical protein
MTIETYLDTWTIFQYLFYPLEFTVCGESKQMKDQDLTFDSTFSSDAGLSTCMHIRLR